ncbi:MAG: nitrous oxide-stimulated promoter family protein [Candidatus Neomarinimicrobiota bacterium]
MIRHRKSPGTVELRTIRVMIAIYCGPHHKSDTGLCSDCHGLFEYASARLDNCPFGAAKPTCQNCPIHCYKPEVREQVRAVMRFAGPRMLWRYPLLTIRHLWHNRKRIPLKTGNSVGSGSETG